MHSLLFFAIVLAPVLARSTTHQNPSTPAHDHKWCIPSPVTGDEQADIFSDFQKLAWSGKPALIEYGFHKYVVEDYIQHNPFLPQGAAPVVDLLKSLTGTTKLEAVRMAFDAGLGFVHSRGSPKPGKEGPMNVLSAIVDIYRMNGSCIVEHWDVMQPVPGNATNELGMF